MERGDLSFNQWKREKYPPTAYHVVGETVVYPIPKTTFDEECKYCHQYRCSLDTVFVNSNSVLAFDYNEHKKKLCIYLRERNQLKIHGKLSPEALGSLELLVVSSETFSYDFLRITQRCENTAGDKELHTRRIVARSGDSLKREYCKIFGHEFDEDNGTINGEEVSSDGDEYEFGENL